MTVSHQIRNINKEKFFFKKSQMKILKLKNTITEMKSLLGILKSRFDLAEKRISKLEDKWIKIMQFKEQRLKKRVKKNEQILKKKEKYIWDIIRHTNIHIVRVPG